MLRKHVLNCLHVCVCVRVRARALSGVDGESGRQNVTRIGFCLASLKGLENLASTDGTRWRLKVLLYVFGRRPMFKFEYNVRVDVSVIGCELARLDYDDCDDPIRIRHFMNR